MWPVALPQVVDDMGNVKFALDTGPDATGNSWLKYVRCALSFEEQNLAACHLTGDQVSDAAEMCWPDCVVQLWERQGHAVGKRWSQGEKWPLLLPIQQLGWSVWMCVCVCVRLPLWLQNVCAAKRNCSIVCLWHGLVKNSLALLWYESYDNQYVRHALLLWRLQFLSLFLFLCPVGPSPLSLSLSLEKLGSGIRFFWKDSQPVPIKPQLLN